MNSDSASVTSPSANTPIVWVTVTVAPSRRACRGGSPRPDEIGGHDRLSVPGAERVDRAPEEREQEREEDEADVQVPFGDQPREAAVAGLPHPDARIERLARRDGRGGAVAASRDE